MNVSQSQQFSTPGPLEKTTTHKPLALKVINPKKKKDFKVYQLDYLKEVTSESKLKQCIFNKVGKNVVRYDLDFEVGYIEGTKRMSFPSDEFEETLRSIEVEGKYLWCFGLTEESTDDGESLEPASKRKKSTTASNSIEVKSDRIEGIANDLKERHGEKYTRIQYKLWAEVIDSKKHDSMDDPPKGSIWSGLPGKQKDHTRKEGGVTEMASAFTTLANSVSAALQPKNASPKQQPESCDPMIISPGRKIDLQAKVLHNLQLLHNMYEKGAITTAQFEKRREALMQQLDVLD